MKYVPKVKFVDVFIEHWRTDLDTYKSPPSERKMVIEEIHDPGVNNVGKRQRLKNGGCKKKKFLDGLITKLREVVL